MNNPLVIKPHSVIWTTDVDWALNNLFCSEVTESDGLIQQSSVVCPDRKPRQRNRKTCYARRGDVVRDRRKQTDGVVKEGVSEAQWHYRHSRKKLDGFWRKSEVCSGGFYSFETQNQSRIPPVRSYRRKNCVLVAFPVLVSDVTASSDFKTVNRSVYKCPVKHRCWLKQEWTVKR